MLTLNTSTDARMSLRRSTQGRCTGNGLGGNSRSAVASSRRTKPALRYWLTSNHQSIDLTATVDWKIERYSVLEVSEELDSEWMLTALSEGSSRIYAEYNELRSPFVEVYVTAAALTQIDITPEVVELMEGDQPYFRAVGSYSDGSTGPLGTDLRWITGDGEILQINDVGVATAVAPGETTVTAQYGDVLSEEAW